MADPLADLSDKGVSIWLDDLSRRAAIANARLAYYADARQVLGELEAVGVDYGNVTDALERNGLAAFDAAWRELGDQIAARLRHLERRPTEEESGE